MKGSGAGLALTALALLLAACGPSGFDGLTGGTRGEVVKPPRVDETVIAPRPTSPLSVTLVDTLRPELRWSLSGDLTGAVIELCRTRACTTVEKTFTAKGSRFPVPEDLAQGVWFWRLRGVSNERTGTKDSATFEFVVRGAPKGPETASTFPYGSFVDVNGDGFADLVVLVLAGSELLLETYHGDAEGTLTRVGSSFVDEVPPGTELPVGFSPSIASGLDLDGDGFADTVLALPTSAGSPFPQIPLSAYLGSEKGLRELPIVPSLPQIAGASTSVSMAGDFDGDGYGDLVAGAPGSAFVVNGGSPWRGRLVSLLGSGAPQKTGLFVLGGFDWNRDGFSDALVSLAAKDAHAGIVTGGDKRETSNLKLEVSFPLPRAVAGGTSLDFDSDGKRDLVLATEVTGPCEARPGVEAPAACGGYCAFRGADLKFIFCSELESTKGAISRFGASVVALDLDASGRDTLLVDRSGSAASAVEIVKLPASELELDESRESLPARGFGAALTVISPGRPGAARWAGVADSLTAVRVFAGEQKAFDLPSRRVLAIR
jgi:hypothetical protein